MNLIITCARNFEQETKGEIKEILKKLGDIEPEISISKISGILIGKTSLDPFTVVNQVKAIVLEEPWVIRYTLRIIPINRVVKTTLDEIENEIPRLVKTMQQDETYRISIKKRNSNISSKELIIKIADKIQNKVSLENPDKIILIEILGEKSGIALIKPNDIFSKEKIKRSISE